MHCLVINDVCYQLSPYFDELCVLWVQGKQDQGGVLPLFLKDYQQEKKATAVIDLAWLT